MSLSEKMIRKDDGIDCSALLGDFRFLDTFMKIEGNLV